mgnify:CR=1 FL=1
MTSMVETTHWTIMAVGHRDMFDVESTSYPYDACMGM